VTRSNLLRYGRFNLNGISGHNQKRKQEIVAYRNRRKSFSSEKIIVKLGVGAKRSYKAIRDT
jgi:hypothetical protein